MEQIELVKEFEAAKKLLSDAGLQVYIAVFKSKALSVGGGVTLTKVGSINVYDKPFMIWHDGKNYIAKTVNNSCGQLGIQDEFVSIHDAAQFVINELCK